VPEGDALLRVLRKTLRQAADVSRAPAMQAYMKSAMPYHGVPLPLVRKLCKAAFADLGLVNAAEWQGLVLALWRGAKFREERYAALSLCAQRCAADFQTPPAMKMYEELIVTGAWWDYVDDIAAHRVGVILRGYPGPLRRKMLSWSRCDNLWKRRTAILCQLEFKAETDLDLLYACIEPSLGSQEFFLRKAIGWALRQYAWTDGAEIKRYVRLNRARLSALSYREAVKNLS